MAGFSGFVRWRCADHGLQQFNFSLFAGNIDPNFYTLVSPLSNQYPDAFRVYGYGSFAGGCGHFGVHRSWYS